MTLLVLLLLCWLALAPVALLLAAGPVRAGRREDLARGFHGEQEGAHWW